MKFQSIYARWGVPALLIAILATSPSFAGVSRAIQEKYRRNYENKALFLKVPIYTEKQHMFIMGRELRPEAATATGPARLKVGDQVRVLSVDFGGDEIRYKLSAIEGVRSAELVFKFESDLQESFPNSSAFDAALAATFTEGLKYTDLEDSKRGFVEDQFERIVRDLATTSGTTRDFVVKNIAPRLAPYQDAIRDVENLKNKNQELAGQIGQLQSDNRRLDSEVRQQQAEASRLKNLAATLQEKMDSSASQLNRLGEDLRNARGVAQGYQSQLANLQRSLNLKVDSNRDLASQIGDLGQAMRKLQKEQEGLESQNSSLKSNLDTEQALNRRLSGEVEDLKAAQLKMNETVQVLSSKEDSLARQYLALKRQRDKLEEVTSAVRSLEPRIVEEKSKGGVSQRATKIYLGDIHLGSVEWLLPERLSYDEQKTAEVRFLAQSIDYVRLSPPQRQLLQSLGQRMKLAITLDSQIDTITIKPHQPQAAQEVGERDQATWRWNIHNQGTQDGRLKLTVALVNRNADEIPILREEHAVVSSSMVRQVRSQLQPLPIAAGVLLGFLLFGIVGVFLRGRKPQTARKGSAVTPSEPPPYAGQKQL